MDYFITLIGFILIFIGGQYLVSSAVNISNFLRLPQMVVGILIVGIGTSIPELAISFYSLAQGHAELLVGNILGSNIANVLLVLGAAACIKSFPAVTSHLKTNTLLILCSAFLLLLGFFLGAISISIAVLMVIVLIGGVTALCQKSDMDTADTPAERPFWLEISILILAVLALTLGARFIVEGAVSIAESIGISETLIGLTLVAIGTSLPELVFSLIAIKKNHPSLVIGNIVGSNIFNILLGIGIPALFWPIKTNWRLEKLSLLVFIATSLLLSTILIKKVRLKRAYGWGLLTVYIVFLGTTCYLA